MYRPTNSTIPPLRRLIVHQPPKFQQNRRQCVELLSIQHIFSLCFSRGEIVASFSQRRATLLRQILRKCRTIIGAFRVCFIVYIHCYISKREQRELGPKI